MLRLDTRPILGFNFGDVHERVWISFAALQAPFKPYANDADQTGRLVSVDVGQGLRVTVTM